MTERIYCMRCSGIGLLTNESMTQLVDAGAGSRDGRIGPICPDCKGAGGWSEPTLSQSEWIANDL